MRKNKEIVRKRKEKRHLVIGRKKGCPTPRQTGRMTVGHKLNSIPVTGTQGKK
jgi:hypothetical protein